MDNLIQLRAYCSSHIKHEKLDYSTQRSYTENTVTDITPVLLYENLLVPQCTFPDIPRQSRTKSTYSSTSMNSSETDLYIPHTALCHDTNFPLPGLTPTTRSYSRFPTNTSLPCSHPTATFIPTQHPKHRSFKVNPPTTSIPLPTFPLPRPTPYNHTRSTPSGPVSHQKPAPRRGKRAI